MWLKALNVISQITIIILALIIVIAMSKKQVIDSTFTSFEAKIQARLEDDRKHFDEKVLMVQDNLNRYQLNREQRAQHFSERLDELYSLYKKNPDPIILANSQTPGKIVADTVDPSVGDKNFSYLESKANRIDEKVDSVDSRLSSKVLVLEQRVESLQADKKSNTKVIQNNIQTVNNNVQK